LGTSPTVTSLVITAPLIGFALAGLLPEGRPRRTLAVATIVTLLAGAVAAASPGIWLLVAARLVQGLGIGFLVAGGLADIARNMPQAIAGRLTGWMIGGTALGGLLGRGAGYAGLAVSWRGAFLLAAAALLVTVTLALRSLPPENASRAEAPSSRRARAPLRLILPGLGILFVNVGMFDLLPYRLTGPPFRLPALLADLVYVTYVPATFVAQLAGRAVDRFGARRVNVAVALGGAALLLGGLWESAAAAVFAGLVAISGTTGLQVASSGAAARYGRTAVGRYLAAYYVGGALAAPVLASVYSRAGWPAAILLMSAAWLAVALVAAAGQEPDGAEVQGAELERPPAGGFG
jgi:YNFM family putative membrane transporter